MTTTHQKQKGRDSGKSATPTTTAYGSSVGNGSSRADVLHSIVSTFPGITAADQRRRIVAALEQLGSLTTFEMMRHLDCYDPRPRIHELRHEHGYAISTIMRAEQTESGVMHRVGVYVLKARPGRGVA